MEESERGRPWQRPEPACQPSNRTKELGGPEHAYLRPVEKSAAFRCPARVKEMAQSVVKADRSLVDSAETPVGVMTRTGIAPAMWLGDTITMDVSDWT